MENLKSIKEKDLSNIFPEINLHGKSEKHKRKRSK